MLLYRLRAKNNGVMRFSRKSKQQERHELLLVLRHIIGAVYQINAI